MAKRRGHGAESRRMRAAAFASQLRRAKEDRV